MGICSLRILPLCHFTCQQCEFLKMPPHFCLFALTDLRGLGMRSLSDQNFFNFMRFFRKWIKYIWLAPPSKGWRPFLREVLDPPLLCFCFCFPIWTHHTLYTDFAQLPSEGSDHPDSKFVTKKDGSVIHILVY